jgi:hypothetical protein
MMKVKNTEDRVKRLTDIERGVRALLDHYGIDPQPADA